MSAPDITQQGRVRFMTPVNVVTVVDAVIPNGVSTSGIIDLDAGQRQVVGLQMPAAWTAAALTFEGSHDGTTFVVIHNGTAEFTVLAAGGAAASLGVSLIKDTFAPWPFVRIRSGVIGAYVNQLAERTIKVLTKAG